MILEILLALFLGVLAGSITGLTPGLHTNTLALLMLSITLPFSLLASLTILLSMSITHTIIDTIPSIFLGVPDGAMVVSALPGHKLFLSGRGLDAIYLATLGGVVGMVCCIFFALPLFLFMQPVYVFIRPYTFYLLLGVLLFLFIRETKRFAAFFVLLLSGIFGWSVFHIEYVTSPLFHMLTGLFGLSLLWCSLDDCNSFVEQKKVSVSRKYVYTSFVACLAGVVAAFLPGVGSAQVAILAQSFVRKITDEGFLVLTGGINTANMFVSLITYYAIEKARNGSIVALGQMASLDIWAVILLLAVMLCAVSIASIIVIPMATLFGKSIAHIGVHKVTVFLLVSLVGVSLVLDGFLGLLILFGATMLGYVVQQLGLPKHYLMGCLLIPVLIYIK